MKLNLYIAAIVFVSLVSCEQVNLEVADNNVAVVESYIHPGEDAVINVKEQLVYNSYDTATQYLNNLNLVLSDGENIYTFENTGAGNYENHSFVVEENKEYTLEFSYNDKIVSAYTLVPDKPTDLAISLTTIEVLSFDSFDPSNGPPERPDPVTISYSNTENDYHMIVVECTESSPTLVNSSTDRPVRTFRSRPVQGNSQQLDPMQFTYLGSHRLILYKLNAEYAELYERMETSSLDIEAPPSNIENGLGIFTGINSDTLYLNVVAM